MKLRNLFEMADISQALIDAYHRDFNEWPLDAPLGRIDSRTIPIGISAPRATPRTKSQAGTGAIQDFLKSQPSWADVPDRNLSVFATTSPDEGHYADIFGGNSSKFSYRLIPRNGTTVALVQDDFNEKSFKIEDDTYQLADFVQVRTFERISQIIELDLELDDEPTIRNLKSAISEIRAHLKKGYTFDRSAQVRPLQALVQYLDRRKELTPEFLGIELVTTADYVKPSAPHEAWFSDEYICIPAADWDDFVREVK